MKWKHFWLAAFITAAVLVRQGVSLLPIGLGLVVASLVVRWRLRRI